MQIDIGLEVYKFLIGIIMVLFGIFNGFGLFILKSLKKTDDELFSRLREIEKEFAELKGEHKVNHKGGK